MKPTSCKSGRPFDNALDRPSCSSHSRSKIRCAPRPPNYFVSSFLAQLACVTARSARRYIYYMALGVWPPNPPGLAVATSSSAVIAAWPRILHQPELAIGAISEGGEVHLNSNAEEALGDNPDYLGQERRHQLAEIGWPSPSTDQHSPSKCWNQP